MKREPQELLPLVRQYEQKMSEASVPLWMDAPDILDVLDYYEQSGLYFESEQCMRMALRLHPEHPEVLVRKAYRLKNEGKWDEAIDFVRKCSQQGSIEVLFFEAEYALSLLHFEEAESHFQNALKQSEEEGGAYSEAAPLNKNDLYLEMGELFMDYGSPRKAIKYLAYIQEGTLEYPRAQTLWAECDYQLGDAPKALERLNQILDEDPYNLDAWILTADLCQEMGNFERCNEAAKFALAIDYKHEKALRFKAVSALSLERLDEVLEVYEIYQKYYPQDYTMALSAGEILMYKNQLEAARTVLTRSNQACPNENPDKQRILSDIALTYIAKKDFSKAHEILLGCTSLGLTYAEVLLLMTELCLRQNAVNEASRYLDTYIQQNPLNSDTRLRISRMLVEAQIFDELSGIWENLLRVTEVGPTLAAPYLAIASRKLLRIREFFFWIAYASYEDPTLTQQLFAPIYPNTLPSDYLLRAQEEFPANSF